MKKHHETKKHLKSTNLITFDKLQHVLYIMYKGAYFNIS